jgi:CubicO group peptidase (beta-lactamase class C family)
MKSHCKNLFYWPHYIVFIALCGLSACNYNESNKDKKNDKINMCHVDFDILKPKGKAQKKWFAQRRYTLDTLLNHQYCGTDFNGTVAIYQKDMLLFHKTQGFADIDQQIPLNDSSKFQLASVSKTFTAIAILRLCDAKKIKLTDSVEKFIANFPFKGITIENLLSHRSGLPNYIYIFSDRARENYYPKNDDILNWLGDYAQRKDCEVSSPGKNFSYNNTNYIILASIIQKVVKMPFDTYMRNYIFIPFGMKNTFFATQDSAFINSTLGHNAKLPNPKDFYDEVLGDKGVYSTAADMYKWYKLINSDCFLSASAKKVAFTARSFEKPGKRNYGLGFRMFEWNDDKWFIYHTGWWNGYASLFWLHPEKEILIVFLCNKRNRKIYSIFPIAEALMDERFNYSDSSFVKKRELSSTSSIGDTAINQ